ncbi:diphthine synthase [Candidatus Woesearchaeota archaeon]|nr:diphthine synthase [Candidatus Woesearchaeota archaeon]
MTLYFIGIGLNDEKDITVKGLSIVKKCDFVYLESYTSILQISISKLEEYYGKKIILANRELVEKKAEETILKNAKDKEVAFLVIGDPMCATTHTDLLLRAKKAGIKTSVVHNTSIINAIGITGLEVYKFGKVTSIPFENSNVKAPYEVLERNLKNDLHTLFLLDLNPEESRFLTIKEATEYLIKQGMPEEHLCVGCARIGAEDFFIKKGKASEIKEIDFGKPPYCLVVPAKLHFIEEEALGRF